MNTKIDSDAFALYYGLGAERSYQAVAKHYGATKRAVVAVAKRERWQQRIVELEREARARTDRKIVETLEQMNERHLKTMQLVQKKALEALKEMPLATAMEAVRALVMAVEKERLIRGEPTDRNAVTVEAIIEREYERWLKPAPDAVEEGTDA